MFFHSWFLYSENSTLIMYFGEYLFLLDQWHDHIMLFDLTGIVPASTLPLDVYWKEMDADSDWVNHSVASYLCYSVGFL